MVLMTAVGLRSLACSGNSVALIAERVFREVDLKTDTLEDSASNIDISEMDLYESEGILFVLEKEHLSLMWKPKKEQKVFLQKVRNGNVWPGVEGYHVWLEGIEDSYTLEVKPDGSDVSAAKHKPWPTDPEPWPMQSKALPLDGR